VAKQSSGDRKSDRGRSQTSFYVIWRRLKRNRLAVAGLFMVLLLSVISAAAPWIAPCDRDKTDITFRNQPPGPGHWLGTDNLGRDLLTRLIWGGRISLTVGLVAMSISISIGILLGSISGSFGGLVDSLIMRFTDMVMSFPSIALMIVLAAILKPGIYTTMLVIGFLGWAGTARLVRGQILSLREQEFVEAARAAGAGRGRLIIRHLLPNSMAPVIVSATLGVATAILAEAGLSFLGLGVQIPTPSWGNMLNAAMSWRVLTRLPFQWVPAGICIFVAVMSINLVGDGLRDALDPRLKT